MRSSGESAALTGAEALALMALTVSGGVVEMADAEPALSGAARAAAGFSEVASVLFLLTGNREVVRLRVVCGLLVFVVRDINQVHCPIRGCFW